MFILYIAKGTGTTLEEFKSAQIDNGVLYINGSMGIDHNGTPEDVLGGIQEGLIAGHVLYGITTKEVK